MRELMPFADNLDNQPRRWLWLDRGNRRAFTMMEHLRLIEDPETPSEQLEGLSLVTFPEQTYYEGLLALPQAGIRAIDLAVFGSPLGEPGGFEGKRVLVPNFSAKFLLHMMAAGGAEVVGTHNDLQFEKLYSAGSDGGEVASVIRGEPGSIGFAWGTWPGDPSVFGHRAAEVRDGVGGGYDLIVLYRTYLNGLINPPAVRRIGANEFSEFEYGVEPAEMAEWLARSLNPGGRVVVYGLGRPQVVPFNQYRTDADVRCPISPDEAESAGLRVLVHDADENPGFFSLMRSVDIATNSTRRIKYNDARALYSVFEKPAG
ncbi:MAG: hypothetical protein AAF108_01495 [Planctomycetota bacterium]